MVASTFTWNTSGTANWNTGTDWQNLNGNSNNGNNGTIANGNANIGFINQGGVTLTSNQFLSNLTVNNGSLFINTANTTLTIQNTLTLNNANSTGGLININTANATLTTKNLTVLGGTLNMNAGTLSVTTAANFNQGTVNLSGGTFNGNAAITVNGGTLNLNGASANIGTVNVNQGTFNLSAGTISGNNSAITVNNTGNFNIAGGTFNVGGSAATNLNGGTTTLSGGNFNGNGTLTVRGGNFNITGGNLNNFTVSVTGGTLAQSGGKANVGVTTVSGGNFNVSAGTYNAGSNNLTVNGGTFNQSGGTINVNSATFNGGTDTINGVFNASGTGTGGTLTVGTPNGTTQRLNIGSGGAVTLNGLTTIANSNTATFSTINMAGGTLTINNLTFGGANAQIIGNGTINGAGNINNGGTINATGTLTVATTINSGVVLAINSGAASTLNLNGQATSAAAVGLTAGNQTLQVAGSGNLTISVQQTVGGGHISLLSGSLLNDTAGILVNSGDLTGAGTVTTTGGAGTDVEGAGTIKASGGTLDFKNAVDQAGTASTIQIGSGSGDTLKFEGTVGTVSITPTVTFLASSGSNEVLDLSSITLANFHASVAGFKDSEGIKIASAASFTKSGSGTSWTVTALDSNNASLGNISLTGTNYSSTVFHLGTGALAGDMVTCFMPGTLIRTPDGERLVETFKPDDLVLTVEGRVAPVRWVGRQTVSRVFGDPMRVLPIRIRAGALGETLPARDLLLSPDHAVLIDGVLVQAGALVNGTSVVREQDLPLTYTYFHLELDDHALVVAEGLPAETFIDNVDRLAFDNWDEHEALYPDGKPIVEMDYPRAKAYRQVPRSIRDRVAGRAVALWRATATSAA